MNQKLGIINQELEVMSIKAGLRKYESNFSECKSMNKSSHNAWTKMVTNSGQNTLEQESCFV